MEQNNSNTQTAHLLTRKNLALLLVAGLTAAVVSGLAYYVGNAITSESTRAVGEACRTGTCTVDISKFDPEDFGKWEIRAYRGTTLLDSLLIETSQDSVLNFQVDDFNQTYSCKVESTLPENGSTILCAQDSLQNSCTVITCACTAGNLDCSDRTIGNQGAGLEGPGMIVMNPKFTPPVNGCFECDEIIVRDATTEEPLFTRFDCSGNPTNYVGPSPAPTGIRVHQARGGACRRYEAFVRGHNPTLAVPSTTPAVELCGECNLEICCPACEPPKTLPIPGDQNGALSCAANKCNFEVVPQDSCISYGEELEIILDLEKAGACIDFDDDFASDISDGSNSNRDKRICKVKDSATGQLRDLRDGDRLRFLYPDAGVYDLTLNCDPGGTAPESTQKDELVCRKRVTAACPGSPPPTPTATPGPSPTPSSTPTPSPSPTPSATPTPSPTPSDGPSPTPSPTPTPPPFCPINEDLNVRINCPLCESN